MPLTLRQTAEKAAYDAFLKVMSHPGVHWRAQDLRFRRDADLSRIAQDYGVRLATMEKLNRPGIDNTAYRFHRDRAWFDFLRSHADELQGATWLDVGADSGALSAYMADMLNSPDYALCDAIGGERGYVAASDKEVVGSERLAANGHPVRLFDGKQLDYADKQFDMVLFSYVLHHAADNTTRLLQDASRIARRYIVIMEDPKESDADYLWAFKHDKRGTFRGLKEWRDLFSLLGLSIVLDCPLMMDIHSRHLFVVTPQAG